jgi:hypothetical protein
MTLGLMICNISEVTISPGVLSSWPLLVNRNLREDKDGRVVGVSTEWW